MSSLKCVLLSLMPWEWAYRPVRKQARLGEQSDVVTKALVKRAPSLAIRSMFGVFRKGCPAQLIASYRWSSVRMNTKFGRSGEAKALAMFKNGRLAAATPAPLRNSLLVNPFSLDNKITPFIQVFAADY